MLIGVAVVALLALASTFLARTVTAPQATDVTDPDVPASTSSTSLPSVETGLDPLSSLVPGFEGTLLMTVGLGDTVERWEWPAAASTPIRLPLFGHLSHVSLDASGRLVGAIERFAHNPRALRVGEGPDLGNVFSGVHSYAWHATEPGALAWISQNSPDTAPQVHVAYSRGRIIFAQPLTDLTDVDFLDPEYRGGVRIAAYDDSGVVIERWSRVVSRISPTGELIGEVGGAFIGRGLDGTIAVSSAGEPQAPARLFGPALEPVGELDGPSASVAWTEDGSARAAIGPGPVIEVVRGSDTAALPLPVDNAEIKVWTSDGRFVIVAGVWDEIPTLAFVDTENLSVHTVRLSAFPISVRVID